jgi:hypothetical protein
MTWFRVVLQELWGLFVDDGLFALSILVWLVVVGWILPRLGLSPVLTCLLFAAGLAALLTTSALRRAGKQE